VSTSIDCLEAHSCKFSTIKRTDKFKKNYLQRFKLLFFWRGHEYLHVLMGSFHEISLDGMNMSSQFFSRISCTHGFLREDQARVRVQLRWLKIYPHTFLNFKRIQHFGNPHILVHSPDGVLFEITSITKFY
jgi:catechol 2,3-dioxygenase-like lactoylglutathione lyase family enzyme